MAQRAGGNGKRGKQADPLEAACHPVVAAKRAQLLRLSATRRRSAVDELAKQSRAA